MENLSSTLLSIIASTVSQKVCYHLVALNNNSITLVFGFASSDILRDARSLNVGLRDQRLGIQWVKDNIHIFGGDPDNITIFGESDGATGVGLQLTAFGGKRRAPFHRAIMQSGAATTDTGTNSNTSATGYATVAAITNCTRGSPGSAETLACMRNLPLETLLNATFTYAIAKSPPFGFSV
jgi:carboxylesterase type B